MFEKEAEEWWNNEYSPSLYDNVSEVFKTVQSSVITRLMKY